MIFYFSATGNSKYVADRLAQGLDDTIVSIADCLKKDDFNFTVSEGERVGFVTPVYHWGLPSIVVDFMENIKLKGAFDSYTYHVVTYGTTTGKANKMMAEELSKKGIRLQGKFAIQMPDTWTPIFDLNNKAEVYKLLVQAEAETERVVNYIKGKIKGDFNNKKVPFAEIYYHHYRGGGKTRKFTVKNSCISCGLCEKQCPVSAIQMQDGKPVWVKDRCVQCLGCLHHCPKFAIQFGRNTEKHGQYVNPYSKVKKKGQKIDGTTPKA